MRWWAGRVAPCCHRIHCNCVTPFGRLLFFFFFTSGLGSKLLFRSSQATGVATYQSQMRDSCRCKKKRKCLNLIKIVSSCSNWNWSVHFRMNEDVVLSSNDTNDNIFLFLFNLVVIKMLFPNDLLVLRHTECTERKTYYTNANSVQMLMHMTPTQIL